MWIINWLAKVFKDEPLPDVPSYRFGDFTLNELVLISNALSRTMMEQSQFGNVESVHLEVYKTVARLYLETEKAANQLTFDATHFDHNR